MPTRKLTIEAFPFMMLTYAPNPIEEIGEVSIPVPILRDDMAVMTYRERVGENIRRRCGNAACHAVANLSVSRGLADVMVIDDANFYCDTPNCSLGESGGESGDREPRNPLQPTSLLSAQVETA